MGRSPIGWLAGLGLVLAACTGDDVADPGEDAGPGPPRLVGDAQVGRDVIPYTARLDAGPHFAGDPTPASEADIEAYCGAVRTRAEGCGRTIAAGLECDRRLLRLARAEPLREMSTCIAETTCGQSADRCMAMQFEQTDPELVRCANYTRACAFGGEAVCGVFPLFTPENADRLRACLDMYCDGMERCIDELVGE